MTINFLPLRRSGATDESHTHVSDVLWKLLDGLSDDPWPPSPRGRSRRKAVRQDNAVDVRKLPSPRTAATVIEMLGNDQPGSRNYQEMTATVFYSGLRPSETAMLRVRALRLPHEGWGSIAVDITDDGTGEPAEPMTGKRPVPIPPVLVARLRQWIDERQLELDDYLFRTRQGNRPNQSNWCRALQNAHKKAKVRTSTSTPIDMPTPQ